MTKGQLIIIASAAAVVATATTLTVIAINNKKKAAKALAEAEVAEEAENEKENSKGRTKEQGGYPLVIAGIDDLLKMFNFYGLDLTNYWVHQDANGKLVFGPTTQNFKEGLRYIIEKTDGHFDSWGNEIVTVVAESD